MRHQLSGFIHLLRWIGGYGGLPVAILVSVGRVVLAYGALRQAEVVVVMSEGGFGHTITGPDVARRLFVGKKCLFFTFSEYNRHNWKTSRIWPDVHVVFLPLTLGVTLGGRVFGVPLLQWYKRIVPRISLWLFKMAAGSGAEVLFLLEVYPRLLDRYAELIVSPNGEPTRDQFWPSAYMRLVAEVEVEPVRLPPKHRLSIQAKLDMIGPDKDVGPPRRRCCLYLRQKGAESGDPHSINRNGSPFEHYLDGIRQFNSAGYQVLLTGDFALTPSVYQEFGGMLVDAKSIGMSEQLFSIFAATESSCAVLETGGGFWLPMINKIPILQINTFPYSHGLPNSWVFYKSITNSVGDLVHYKDLQHNYAWDHELRSMTIHSMSESEITESISYFINDIEDPNLTGPAWHDQSFPRHTFIGNSGARLLPGYLELYENVPSEQL